MKENEGTKNLGSELFRISDELDQCRERINGIGLLIDSLLETLKENEPTEETLISLRYLFQDRFIRETEKLAEVQEKMAEAQERLRNQALSEAETESGDSQCNDVYKAIEEVPVADHEMNRDEIRQIMDKAWKPSQDADGAFNAIVDAYNYGFSQGYKTGLAKAGVKKCI